METPRPAATQCTNHVLLVEPKAFRFNAEAAVDNAFMNAPTRASDADFATRALREHEGFAEALRAEGVRVSVYREWRPDPSPDALFPNNWFSTHADGTAYLYPMFATNRRRERDESIFDYLPARPRRIVDLTGYEAEGRFLEGTGSLVLDRVNRVAYACASLRTDPELVDRWCALANYTSVIVGAYDVEGAPIYHTNVLMSVGTRRAVVCLESIEAEGRARVVRSLERSGHELVEITPAQLGEFGGNALEVLDGAGQRRWVMSERAAAALDRSQVRRLSERGPIVTADLATIEHYGGGSARCMLGELFG